ncbi:TRIC cation channel family protein [Streptomyces tendae]
MGTESAPLLALDLTGTFAFGLNGALTAVRAARLDVVGVVVLGMITALARSSWPAPTWTPSRCASGPACRTPPP